MAVKKEGKISFLKYVRDAKDIIFGAFSDKLTKEDKKREWKSIHEKALVFGLIPANKEYIYTRDTYWQNLKKYTMKKIDNRNRTGSAGGTDCKLFEADILVLDILGRDSPLVQGLPSSETWQTLPASSANTTAQQHVEENMEQQNTFNPPIIATPKQSDVIVEKRKTSRKEHELMEKKIKLSIEIMEKDSYLKSLQILKMERELGLPPSVYTRQFPTEFVLETTK